MLQNDPIPEKEGVYPRNLDLIREAISWTRVLTKELQREMNGIPNSHNRAAAQLSTVLNAILYLELVSKREEA